MPSIPQLREGQRLSQGGVSGFQDTSIARSQGENLALLGRTVASVSKSLQEERKTDTFARSQWVQLAAADAGTAKDKYMSANKQAPKKDDGSTLEDNYNKFLGDSKNKFLDTVPDEFKSEASMAYDIAKLKNTSDVFKEVEVRRKSSSLYNYDETTKKIVNDASINPDKANEYLQAGIDHITVATNTGVLSPEFYEDNVKGVSKQIASAQIDGYLKKPENSMDIPLYDKAMESLERSKDLFTPEEFDKKAKGILTAKYTGTGRIIKSEQDAEENRIKQFKSKQEAEIDNTYQQLIENQNDPVKVSVLKRNLMDRFREGKYKYAAPAAFKAILKGGDFQDNAISFEIQKRLGTKPSMKDINNLRDDVIYMQADDKLSAPEAREWLERLKNLKEQNKKDPNYSTKVRSLMDYIKFVHQVSKLDDLTDLDANVRKSVLFSVYQANAMLGRGEDPDRVLQVLQARYKESKIISGVPANIPYSSKTNRTLDSEKAFDEEEEDIYSSKERGIIESSEYRRRMRETNNLRKAFMSKKSLSEKFMDQLNAPIDPNILPRR